MIGHLIFLITFVKTLLNILVIMSKKEVIFVTAKSDNGSERLVLHQSRSNRNFTIEIPVLYSILEVQQLVFYVNIGRNKRANLNSVDWYNPSVSLDGMLGLSILDDFIVSIENGING